jgi:hypothetical protein
MPSNGKHPNSFVIHSAKSLHWTIFVSELTLELLSPIRLWRRRRSQPVRNARWEYPQTVTNGHPVLL